jgi:pimeloyl-ACP methyl ester carboxylesterase
MNNRPTRKAKQDKYLSSPDPLVVGAAGCGGLLLATVGLVGGWISFSLFRINHEMTLPPALNSPRYTFISPAAGALSYYADREVQGVPLVLIHSINAAASSYEMKPLFDKFHHQRPVLALDLPGFGFSERSNRRYTPALYVQAIIDFIEKQAQRHPVDVVALSLGGEFAALAAQLRPDLIRSLAIISPTGLSGARKSVGSVQKRPGAQRERVYRLLAIPVWRQALFDLLSSRSSIQWFLRRAFVGQVDTGLLQYSYLTSHQPGALFAPLYFISGKLFTPHVLEDVYTGLTQPGLILYDKDPNTGFERLPELLAQPNWHARQISPTRGLPHFEHLEDTAIALTEFWAGL